MIIKGRTLAPRYGIHGLYTKIGRHYSATYIATINGIDVYLTKRFKESSGFNIGLLAYDPTRKFDELASLPFLEQSRDKYHDIIWQALLAAFAVILEDPSLYGLHKTPKCWTSFD